MRRLVFRCGLLLALLGIAGCGAALRYQYGARPGEPKDATFVYVEGTRVHYLDVGQGPAVVLIHGFGGGIENWAAVIGPLKKKHRVLALDLKGHGWTDSPRGDYSVAAQARLVLGLLDARGVKEAAVVGHSYGCGVALAVALAAPKRVTRLALFDGYVFEDQFLTANYWLRVPWIGEFIVWFIASRPDETMHQAFFDPKYVTQKILDDIERGRRRPGWTAAGKLAAMRAMSLYQQDKRYGEISQPALLLWGREDVVTPVSFGERLCRELPNAHILVYPRCGHVPMIEAAGTSTSDLVRFLDEEQS
jgi:pimeloyl-ACP methyl ester carboxylesterase